MPRFCVDRDLIGTGKHLVVDDAGFEWSARVPSDTWHLDGHVKPDSDWCLDTVMKLAHVTLPVQPDARFVNAMATLSGSLDQQHVPWQKVMPSRAHRDFVRALVDATVVAMASAPLDYYRTVWVPSSSVFRALKPAAVDAATWRGLVLAGKGNVPAIKSFQPDMDGFAAPITYDRFATLTGRLTVKSGPQILTLKREHRDLLRTRYNDGVIVGVDFVSLEARVLLYEAGSAYNDIDIYEPLAKLTGTTRKIVKGILISMLYGGTGRNTHGISGSGLNSIVKRIDDAFGIKLLTHRLKTEFVASGCITNRFGRKIRIDEPLERIFINYFAQSTGVDVATLGFATLLERLAFVAPSAIPLYVLHDGMYFDVKREELAAIQNIRTLRITGYDGREFPIKVEILAANAVERAVEETDDAASQEAISSAPHVEQT